MRSSSRSGELVQVAAEQDSMGTPRQGPTVSLATYMEAASRAKLEATPSKVAPAASGASRPAATGAAAEEERLRVVRSVADLLGVDVRGMVGCADMRRGVSQHACEAIDAVVRAEKRCVANGGVGREEEPGGSPGIGQRISVAMRHVITGESLEA